MKKTTTIISCLFIVAVFIASCKKEDKVDGITNEFIKRTVAPLIVGEKIDFAYGMGSTTGNLSSAEVIAGIPGATGTLWETVTHRTVNAVDITTVVASNSVTNGATSSVTILDTNATTLRYAYVIPEDARGKNINFKFSTKNSAGKITSVTTPSYKISNMDMKRLITMVASPTGARYFSISDMKAYTQAEVDAGNLSGKIDFIYAYAATITPTTTAYTYAHSFVSPSASSYFPAGFTIPANWTKNSTQMEKKLATTIYDGQLKGDVNSNVYIDDLDLEQQSFTNSANYAITLSSNGGVFMKTGDGKYTAYIYINSVSTPSTTFVISIKRIQNF